MPQVMLNGAGIVPVIGELEPARMPEHVWMDGKGDASALPRTSDNLTGGGRCKRPPAFGHKDVGTRLVTL